ncbi:hypothetical protein PUATCC27989T_00113 [Phytobacter ursingii]|nr:hypothetical protein PUATCC27989T_00113 [Phytobacter ursingii]
MMDLTLFACSSVVRLGLATALLVALWLLTAWSVALA